MPSSFSVKEMVLPMNGQLVFPKDGLIRLTEESSDSSCIGEDVEFTGVTAGSWFDPYNWNISSASAINLISDLSRSPVPHSESVPCKLDDIAFPVDTSFKCRLDGSTVFVKSFSINGMVYTDGVLQSFLTTTTGNQLFPGRADIRISREECRDATGCSCGNDDSSTMAKVCANQASRCPSLECSDPIQPIGHCCLLCCAHILIEYENGFQYEILRQLYSSYLNQKDYQSVQGYMSKTNDNKIQIVFVDGGGDRGLAGEVAQVLHSYLKQDNKNKKMYKISAIQLHSSIHWKSGIPTHVPYTSANSSLGAGSIVAIIFFLLLFGAAGASAYFWYRRRIIPGFSFARFDADNSRVELELGTTPHEDLDPSEPDSSEILTKGFDNPMYQNPSFAQPVYGKDEAESEKEATLIGFDENTKDGDSFM